MADTDILEVVTEGKTEFDAVVPDDLANIFSPKPREAAPEPVKPAAIVADPTPAPAVTKKMSPAQAAKVERARKIEEARTKVQRNVLVDTQIPVLRLEPSKRLETVIPKFEEIAGAGDLKGAAQLLLSEAELRAQEYAQTAAATAVAAERTARIQRQEFRAKQAHTDWDSKLREAGVFDGCKRIGVNPDGSVRYANQEMGEAIYSEDNPAEAAYDLADTIIKVRRGESLDDEVETPAPKPAPAAAPAPVAAAAPAPVVQTRDELSAAVAAAGARPKGIGALTNAGAPTVTFTRDALDRMMETNPDAYMKLMDGNKELSDWHMGRS